ncbi:MAG TPA: DNA adenine methylase [Ilumatobacter sp.]|nr:DNA adenine methylase [Ilumatobacter sp.]
MIKYLGSKRRLVPALAEMCRRSGANTALDLFTGTTRVAQAFKQQGALVTAVDVARYSEVFAQTYIEADQTTVDLAALDTALTELNALPGEPGYFTSTFCIESRFFQPHNGARVDAIRDAIARDHAGSPLEPILLTSLLLAADRVDSTTGLQMAYVKQWAKRASNHLELRMPHLLPGTGSAVRGDAVTTAATLGSFDLAYLDPPYNQHRYFTNYHIWETLVAWDHPEYYGVACKRIDARDDDTKSVFNRKREMPAALAATIGSVDAEVVIVSYNDESWVSLDDLRDMASIHGDVVALAFDSKRYVGAQIGIHNPQGVRVGEVNRTRNLEYMLVAGPSAKLRDITEPFTTNVV